jgi:hypothetical protein
MHTSVILIQAHPRDKVFAHSALEARPLGLFNVLVADHLWTWAQCETFLLLRPSFRNFFIRFGGSHNQSKKHESTHGTTAPLPPSTAPNIWSNQKIRAHKPPICDLNFYFLIIKFLESIYVHARFWGFTYQSGATI